MVGVAGVSFLSLMVALWHCTVPSEILIVTGGTRNSVLSLPFSSLPLLAG